MTRTARRAALAALATATLLLPALASAQSPAPGGSPGPAPSSAPAASAVPGPSGSPAPATSAGPIASVVPGERSAAWTLAVCTAVARLTEAQDPLATVGQAALDGDTDLMSFAAIAAGLLADQATRALEGIGDAWAPGAALTGFLSTTGFSIVDLGVALADADPADADAARAALGSAILAAAGWQRVGDELRSMEAAGELDCLEVPVPSAEPIPGTSQEPATPEPTFFGDPELESRFPREIEGEPLDPASRAGTELLLSNDPSDPTSAERLQDIEDLLAETGHTLEDVSLAFAYAPTDDGFGASITAFRVRGSDAAALLQGLLPLITIDYTDVQQDTVTVAGQEYVRVSDGPYDPQGIYEVLIPRGDTVWAISAADKVLAEIAAALPG